MGKDILGEEVIYAQKGYKRVRRYFGGWIPDALRILHFGWTGQETIVEKDVIEPLMTFEVVEEDKGN